MRVIPESCFLGAKIRGLSRGYIKIILCMHVNNTRVYNKIKWLGYL